jgi:hypothetical protein
MIRRIALVLSLLFAVTAQAAPVDNKDGFWNEWSDATCESRAREKVRDRLAAVLVVPMVPRHEP